MAQPNSMYNAFTTGQGTRIPTLPGGAVNVNALMNNWVSRDIWSYYYTLKLDQGTALAAQYSLFNAASGTADPYPLAGTPVLTHVETNMPSAAGQGFAAPTDLILDRLGFYFLGGGCGTANNAVGTFCQVADMLSFCQYSYFEFKIIGKVFSEGFLELQPSGFGFTGMSTQAQTGVWSLGMVNPHATYRWGNYAKYLAPQMPWSLTLFFPASSGPGAAQLSLLTSAQGGHGLWLRAVLSGLTDRAVQ